jgi:hypothetical protein
MATSYTTDLIMNRLGNEPPGFGSGPFSGRDLSDDAIRLAGTPKGGGRPTAKRRASRSVT